MDDHDKKLRRRVKGRRKKPQRRKGKRTESEKQSKWRNWEDQFVSAAGARKAAKGPLGSGGEDMSNVFFIMVE